MLKVSKNMKLIIYILILIGLTGCGTRLFSPREANPVLEDYVGTFPHREVATLATRAGHRLNIVRMNDSEEITDDHWKRGEFCTEPPPDAMENLASEFGLAVKAAMEFAEPQTGATAKGAGDLEFHRNIATAMSPLLRRSQGLQWNRDNMSFICNAFINRRINKDSYLSLLEGIQKKSAELIEKEIKHLPALDYSISGSLPSFGEKSIQLLAQNAIAKHTKFKVAEEKTKEAKKKLDDANKEKEQADELLSASEGEVSRLTGIYNAAKKAFDADPSNTELKKKADAAKKDMDNAVDTRDKYSAKAKEAKIKADDAESLYVTHKAASDKAKAEWDMAKAVVSLMAAEAQTAKSAVDGVK